MKKKLVAGMLVICMCGALVGCGNATQTEEGTESNQTVEEGTEETEEEMGETEEEMGETVKVTFDYNYDGAPEDVVIEVMAGSDILPYDGATENTAPETPVREGYRFAGWDTSENPVLENGYSTTMWPINDYYLSWYVEVGPAMGVEEESMPLVEDVTLYARWVEPVTITTAEELRAMCNDLGGWYVLGNDIDLTGVEWIPIGTYVSHYEYLNPSWWVESFRGCFDGAGHTISGLNLNTVSFYEDNLSNRKTIRNGVAAMFGAVGDGAEIKDLTLDQVTVDITSDIHYAYVAPLAGMVEGGTFTNLHVTNLDFKVTVSDANNSGATAVTGTYTSLSGMICGVWDGVLDNCSVQGTMDIVLTSDASHQGNAFVGGLLGDGYIPIMNCSSDVVIKCSYVDNVTDAFEAAEDGSNLYNLYCGGITGLAAAMINSPSEGNITIDNQSQAENVKLMCEGGYGMLLDPTAIDEGSNYSGEVTK